MPATEPPQSHPETVHEDFPRVPEAFGPAPSAFTQSTLSARAGRRRRTLTTVVVLSLLAALGAAGGTWLLWPGGGTDDAASAAAPANPGKVYQPRPYKPTSTVEGRITYGLEEPKVRKGDYGKPVPGSWVKGDTFAVTVQRSINGYKFDSEPKWTINTPGEVCGAAENLTDQGQSVVLVRESVRRSGIAGEPVCNGVIAFDIDTGKRLWKAKASTDHDFSGVAVSGGVVAVSGPDATTAYDMDSGKVLWSGTTSSSDCSNTGFTGGSALLTLLWCGDDDNPSMYLQRLDPRTGKPAWNYSLTKGITAAYVLSADPPVIAVAAGHPTPTDVISLDDHGKMRASISLGVDRYSLGCESEFMTALQICRNAVLLGERLYVATSEELDKVNSIVEFDIATGKKKRKFNSQPDRPIYPLRANGAEEILVFQTPTASISQSGPTIRRSVTSILSLNPETGRRDLRMVLPEVTETAWILEPTTSRIHFENNRIYVAADKISGSEPENGRPRPWFAVAYESAI
ncbi:PQQ-binding-like beta-propeller repeat protein [Streptomyces sp. NPDC050418]|uniref:outer membrane protein assembly factor BamB family protein n=1 Tax=Streptomyces sp. NPDC050418 TaxID=3365612 RepID=UPI0037B2C2D6